MKIRQLSAATIALAGLLVVSSVVHAQDLRGWWTFDNPLDLGEDSSSFANGLTAVGTPTFDPAGAVGGALSLNGLDSALTGTPFPAVPTGNDVYSVSAWIKPDSFTNQLGAPPGIVGWGNYGGVREVNAFRLGGTNSVNNYWWGADLEVSAGAVNLSDGAWHHVASSYDGTSRRLFVDGGEVGRDVPGMANVQAVNFAVGRTCLTCSGGEFFDGLIDDVSIYNFGLSGVDAQSLHGGTSPDALVHMEDPPPPAPPAPKLVGLWQFDDPLDLGKDSSPVGNHLTPQGGAAFDPVGVFGGAAQLDGVDDMLDSPGGFPTDVPTGDDAYSITAWMKPNTTGTRGIVGWGTYGDGGGRRTNALRISNDNGFRHYWWGADLDAQDGDVAALGVDLDGGDWHHIAAVYDGSTRTLYLDGQELVSDSPGANNAQPSNFAVGRTCVTCLGGGGEFFDGLLDDVAIFAGALDQEQVLLAMSGDFASIPEPSAAALAAVGLLGILGMRRRRR